MAGDGGSSNSEATALEHPPARDFSTCTQTSLQTYRYNASWEQVVSAYMLRFPTHPRLPVLLRSEIVHDRVDAEQRKRFLVRKVAVDLEAPGWFKRTIGIHELVFYQYTTLDFVKRSMKIHNINDTVKAQAVFGDDCEYRADVQDPSQTYFEQRAFFQLPRAIPMVKFIEKLMAKNYDKHTGEGRHIDEDFCKISRDTGYWDSLKSRGPDGMLNLAVEKPPFGQTSTVHKGTFREISSVAEPTQITGHAGDTLESASLSNVAIQLQEVKLPSLTVTEPSPISPSFHQFFPDYVHHQPAYAALAMPVFLLSFWPLFVNITSPVVICLLTLASSVLLFGWHMRLFPLFWLNIIQNVNHSEAAAETVKKALEDRMEKQENQIPLEGSTLGAETVPENTSISSGRPSGIAKAIKKRSSSQKPTLETRTSDSPVRISKTTRASANPSPVVPSPSSALPIPSKRNSSFSDAEFDRNEDNSASSSEGEIDSERSPLFSAQPPEEEESDEESDVDEEELKLANQPDDDDDVSRIFANLSAEVDTELGDINAIRIHDIRVSVPAFVDRSVYGSDQQISFVIQVTFPNGVKRTVERTYSDFIRLQKYFYKTIPQCKVQLQYSYVPKRKQSNQTLVGIYLDQRRLIVETYLRQLLENEVMAKLGHRVMIEFIRHRGVLFPSSAGFAASARKKLFFTSFTGSTAFMEPPPSTLTQKNGMLKKFRWRTCLRETRISLDRTTRNLTIYCKMPKEPHCVIPVDDIEKMVHLNELSDAAQRMPFTGDKYHFLVLDTVQKESFYFCANRDVILDWMHAIEELKQQHQQEGEDAERAERASLLPGASTRSILTAPYRVKKPSLENGTADSKIILNRRKLVLGAAAVSRRHPCTVIKQLVNEILAIFQEYTDSKCVFTQKIAARLLTFDERCTELQVVDLEKLVSQAERLSFYVNLYHTMIIHSHLELGFGPSPSSSKRLKVIFRTVCYDLHNQIFSIQDVEHSILRAKMSRPISMNNTFFAQLMTPRFHKRDPRNRWALTQPDLRINFVLNSGTKSSIYNVWCFSSDPTTLNHQLDHASTHFLNEQVVISHDRYTIYLPRICQYYAYDLGGSKQRILKTIMRYMSQAMENEVKQVIKQAKQRGYKVKLRYADYDWAVRGVFFQGHDLGKNSMNGGDLCALKQALRLEEEPLVASTSGASAAATSPLLDGTGKVTTFAAGASSVKPTGSVNEQQHNHADGKVERQ